MRRKLLFVLPFLFPATVSIAADDMSSLVEQCNGCHGDKGVSQWSDMPTIAGIDAFTHANALYEYRDGERPCGTTEFRQGDTSREPMSMCTIAENLSDQQIEGLADHYSALPFVPAEQEYDPALATKGKVIHDGACARCHSGGGENADDEASILAGQHMGYLELTFDQYASGERSQLDQMKEKMDPLTEEEVKALIHYYGSQQ